MSEEDFVEGFHQEKQALLKHYFSEAPDHFGQKSAVAESIKELHLDEEGIERLHKILDLAITDVMYTILLALDGEASLGNRQEIYKLYDEDGNELTADGLIEVYAFEYFYGSRK